MLLFVLAVLIRSLFNTWEIATHTYADLRDVSRNISHIIFSLLLSMASFTLVFFLFEKHFTNYWQKGILLMALVWMIIYMVISQSFTGISITVITLLILAPLLVFRTGSPRVRWILGISMVIVMAGLALGLWSVVRDYRHVNPVDLNHLEQTTSRGNPYTHNPYNLETENGNYLWIYVQWDEMRAEWSKRSRIPFDSLNRKHATTAFTMVRYLASKGWRKDGDAVARLTPKEITAIENGCANYIFMESFSIRGRIYEFLWGFDNYRKTGNPTGSTLMQRFEFWKASLGIIRDNWLTGVGTGDMNIAFSRQYEKMHTQLPPDQRWRSHNQYLSVFIGFGILGLLWFLFALLYPPYMLRRYDDFFFAVFLSITLLSMFTGDTIESQTGVSFVAVFYSLFLYFRREKDVIFAPETH